MPSRTFLRINSGDVILEGKWEPDPNVEARVLTHVSAYLADYSTPLYAAREIAVQDTKRRFALEIDPDDRPWQELSESYLAWKEGRGYAPDILQLTSQAGNEHSLSYSAPTGWEVIGDTLVYDSEVLPGYGLAHQEGKGARGRLPKREFIGLSPEAVEKIVIEFDRWADSVEPIFDGPFEEYGSNKLGTFPVISHFHGQPIIRTPRGPRFGRGRRSRLL